MKLQRQIFPHSKQSAPFLRLLLAQDGSTTRLCSALCGDSVQVVLHQQHRTDQVPIAIQMIFNPDTALVPAIANRYLVRTTTLHDGAGNALMDNLSYTRLESVPSWFIEQLDVGKAPIGHLLDQFFVQREPLPNATSVVLQQPLWDAVGMPDLAASRSYQLRSPQGIFMVIFETFRGALVDKLQQSSQFLQGTEEQ